jgi:hypothetical protein
MRKIFLLTGLVFFHILQTIAQPHRVEGTWLDGGSYNNNIGTLSDRGTNRYFRALTSGTSSTRTLLFNNSGFSYNPKWVADNATPLSKNTYLSGGAKRYTSGGTDIHFAVISGNYYTLIVGENSGSNNDLSILETSYNPVNFAVSSPVTQSPSSSNVKHGQTVTVTVNMQSSLSSGEFAYVRYSTDGFTSSSIVAVSMTGSSGTATIPAQNSGVTVQYYAFTSNQSSAPTPAQADYFSLNIRNATGENVDGSNYSYTVGSWATAASGGNWSDNASWVGGLAPVSGTNMGSVTVSHSIGMNQNNTVTALTISSSSTLTINSSSTLSTGGAVTVNTGSQLTINGSLQLNASGSVANVTGIAYGSTGSLIYNTGGSFSQSNEWPASGSPANVIIQTSGTSVALNSDRTISGNFTVSTGAQFRATGTNRTLTFSGSNGVLTNDGTMFGEFGGVFLSIVFDGNTSLAGSAMIDARNFTVNATKTLDAGTARMNSNSSGGTFTLNGTLKTQRSEGLHASDGAIRSGNISSANLTIGSAAVVEYTATGSQTITTTKIYNGLVLSGTGAKNVASGTLELNSSTGSLTIQPGARLTVAMGATADFNNRSVLIQSTASGTGSIGLIEGTVQEATSVTLETYIAGGRRAFRFLSHPFSTTLNMSALTDDIFITGDGTTTGAGGMSTGSGFDASTGNAASSFWYDSGESGFGAWKAFTSSTDNNWASSRGVRVLIRGDRTQTATLAGSPPAPNPVTLDVTGTIHTGSVGISLPAADKYFFVGNPYPSPVDIGTVIDATSNIGTQYWAWDPQASTRGAYVTKTVGSGAYSIPAGSAYFVLPTASTTLNFTETNKTTAASGGNSFFRNSAVPGLFELKLLYNNYPADHYYVRNHINATAALDVWDGKKLQNPDMNMYSRSSANDNLSLDCRNLGAETIIPLSVNTNLQAAYGFKVEANGLETDYTVLLRDKFLNVEQALTSGTVYSFNVTADAASQGNNRFELVFRSNASLPQSFTTFTAKEASGGIAVAFSTANEINVQSHSIEESANGSHFTTAISFAAKNTLTATYNWLDIAVNNGNNYYRVKSTDKNGAISYSAVVNLRMGKALNQFTVAPNTIKGNQPIQVQFNQVAAGQYTLNLYTTDGKQVQSRQVQHAGGSASISIGTEGLAAGIYYLQASSTAFKQTITLVIQ